MQACADKLAREIEQYGVEYLRETEGIIEAAEVRMPTHGICRLGPACNIVILPWQCPTERVLDQLR